MRSEGLGQETGLFRSAVVGEIPTQEEDIRLRAGLRDQLLHRLWWDSGVMQITDGRYTHDLLWGRHRRLPSLLSLQSSGQRPLQCDPKRSSKRAQSKRSP